MNASLRIFLIYCLAHLALFTLGDALYWDDWTILATGADDVRKGFSDLGAPWFGAFHLLMRPWGGLGYHFVTFASFAVASLLVMPILESYNVDKRSAFWVAVLMAVLPLNEARVAAIVVPYAISYGLFFIGWYLMLRGTLLLRLLSLAAFFLSFTTESLLVLYALPLGLLLRRRWLRHLDFALLPLVFFALKTVLFPPSGMYAGYNGVHVSNLFLSLHFLSIMLVEMLDWQTPAAALGFVALAGSVMLLYRGGNLLREAKDYILRRGDTLPLAAAGIVAIVLALLPYYAVERYPGYIDWNSRFQLLLPLGFSMLIVGCIRRSDAKPYALVLLTLSSIIVWNRSYADFYVDWLKQLSIIGELQKNPALRQSKALLWVDQTTDMDALHREYRMYDYAGLFTRAYGTQDHYVLSYSKYTRGKADWEALVRQDRPSFISGLLSKDVPDPLPAPQLVIVAKKLHTYSADNHLSYAVSMMFRKWFQPMRYREKLESLIDVRGPVPLPER